VKKFLTKINSKVLLLLIVAISLLGIALSGINGYLTKVYYLSVFDNITLLTNRIVAVQFTASMLLPYIERLSAPGMSETLLEYHNLRNAYIETKQDPNPDFAPVHMASALLRLNTIQLELDEIKDKDAEKIDELKRKIAECENEIEKLKKHITYKKCKSIIIERTEDNRNLCVDGEVKTMGKKMFEVVPNAVKFSIPSP